MNEFKNLMEAYSSRAIDPIFLPGLILEHLPVDRVDEYMSSLPSDFLEVAVNYVQYAFASGQEMVRIAEPPPENEHREKALRDWVVRAGRFHYPRRPTEPDIGLILARLEPEPEPIDPSRIKKKPWRLLDWVASERLEGVLDALPDDAIAAVAAWANAAPQDDGRKPPLALMDFPISTRGILQDWLRKKGLLTDTQ